MCYICSCFGWILDLFQRALTFCLSCIMSCVVCFGLAVVIAAGIAYGYNYMMAEFLTLARSDVFVYIRRGQFYEKTDLKPHFGRRSGGGGVNDLYSSNSTDYQDTKPLARDIKPLPNTWRKAIDRRNYAENLVSFSGNVKNESIDSPYMEGEQIRPTLPPTKPQMEATVVLIRGPPTSPPNPRRTSIKPEKIYVTPEKMTTIVMRKFYPNPQITIAPEANNEEEFYQEADRPVVENKPTLTETVTEWPPQRRRKIVKKGHAKGQRQLRQGLKSRGSVDYGQEEEEDDIAYKPV